jgi:DNA-binding NarL/FixJ family response regulator
MRILITVEDKAIQRQTLDILSSEKRIATSIYNAGAGLADQLDDNFSIVIVGTGLKDLELQESIIAFKLKHPSLGVLTIGSPVHHHQLLSWLSIGPAAAILSTEIETHLIPILSQLTCVPPPGSLVISSRLLLSLYSTMPACGKSNNYRLTPREKEVLAGITRGLNYKMVGYDMNISRETVRGHVKNIYKKISVRSLTEAVAKAINENLV